MNACAMASAHEPRKGVTPIWIRGVGNSKVETDKSHANHQSFDVWIRRDPELGDPAQRTRSR
jgi:hypothetical protein